jgi:1-aminocyclopropane-1-carboxylate deaminase/D-cysteine desulfhydrase-like pyridoxal-dependent ACC family enzyme
VPTATVAPMLPDNMPDLTPIEPRGAYWLKRDDLWRVAGVPGGKARTCWALAQGATGLVTAGSRASPQVNIVAQIALRLGVPCRAHTPTGKLSSEVQAAKDAGAEIIQHGAGYNSVIVSRAKADAAATGYREIPFGMECQEAVTQTRRQVRAIPAAVKRIVVPVGSGMSLAGILHGLRDADIDLPVLGVVVGAEPYKRLDAYAPLFWRTLVDLVPAGVDYHKAIDADVGGVKLDPHYEAKCVRHMLPGDMLWIVGIRATATNAKGAE